MAEGWEQKYREGLISDGGKGSGIRLTALCRGRYLGKLPSWHSLLGCWATVKAKFHYAIWFEAGRRPASKQIA